MGAHVSLLCLCVLGGAGGGCATHKTPYGGLGWVKAPTGHPRPTVRATVLNPLVPLSRRFRQCHFQFYFFGLGEDNNSLHVRVES